MNILVLMIPMALCLAGLFIAAFFWAASSGQFDDLETPALRILIDSKNKNSKKSLKEASLESERK